MSQVKLQDNLGKNTLMFEGIFDDCECVQNIIQMIKAFNPNICNT